MKRLTIFAALALASCGVGGPADLPRAPQDVADETMADEQAALAAELAYKAARTAVELAVDMGAIRGEAASRVAALDQRAYEALGAARAAYRAGNASSYNAALADARAAITDLLALAGRNGG